MTDPMSVYSGMMMANQYPSQYGGSKYYSGRETSKETTTNDNQDDKEQSNSAVSYVNFNDFDDESGGTYAVSSGKTASPKKYYDQYQDRVMRLRSRRSDASEKGARVWILPVEEQESLDNDGGQRHRRVKRQVHYQSGYEREPPCYGFPLEVNIRSRIKMDQLFPIQGNSQYKKCIKVG